MRSNPSNRGNRVTIQDSDHFISFLLAAKTFLTFM